MEEVCNPVNFANFLLQTTMPATIKEVFEQSLRQGLRRKSLVDCATWAERCRVMPGPSFPGPYSHKHYPWAKEMHNTDADWCAQKAAQMGITEVALNRAFYTIDIKRRDVLYYLPSQTPHANEFSAGRFNPALEMSPYLKNLFSDVQNVGHKRAGGVNLYVRGTRSKTSMKSVPASLLILDELDEMNQENIKLADERQAGQLERQKIELSTPTIAGSGINLRFINSTQEHFIFPCPACKRHIELDWPGSFVLTGEDLHDPKLKNCYLQCMYCKVKLPQETKQDWLAPAKWVPGYEGRDVRGFYINQLYSPTETPYLIAKVFMEAQHDPGKEQQFYNNKLGRTHEVKDARITYEEMHACRDNYTLRPQISQGTIVTMGVDQGADIHYTIRQWFPIINPNSVDINICHRSKLLDLGVVKNFEDLDKLIVKWGVRSTVIDAHPEKRLALSFANRFPGMVVLCFYSENEQAARNVTKWANEPCITVDRTAWLDLFFSRFRNKTTKIPIDTPKTYFDHLHELIRKPEKDRNGNTIARYVVKENAQDHYAHAENYCEIALGMVQVYMSNQNISSPR